MRFLKSIFVIILFIFSFGCLYSDENIIRFSDIIWGISPEQAIIIAGIPDLISYNYNYDYADDTILFYDDNGIEHETLTEIVWISSNVNSNNLIEFAVKYNIPIGVDIERIIDGYSNISFRYSNIPFFNYNSIVFLTFEEGKYAKISYIIHTDNLTIDEKNDMILYIQNYYFQLYGVPEGKSYNEIEVFSIWYLDDAIVSIDLFLPENYPYSGYNNYIDNVRVVYAYIGN
jgi:hypothetical protein